MTYVSASSHVDKAHYVAETVGDDGLACVLYFTDEIEHFLHRVRCATRFPLVTFLLGDEHV